MLIRRETPADVDPITAVTSAAFSRPGSAPPVETRLLEELRRSDAWLPELSLVAVADDDDRSVGHVVCTRGHVDASPALGLGPLSVVPERQRHGVGSALMHAVLGAADALGEPAVVLLGDPAYYARFGFQPAAERGIAPPQPDWAPHFQVRTLHAWTPALRGSFAYAEPFERV